MKNMQIVDGDIVLGTNRRVSFVYKSDKLAQDLRLWLLEPIGTGTLSPLFGSQLSLYIGGVNLEDSPGQIQAEVREC